MKEFTMVTNLSNAPFCNDTFGFLASLKRHEMTHSKEKAFKCFHCDKKFASKGDLRKHEKVHTGEKPYSCSMCNKNFSSSSYLRKHVRSHIGEKKCKGQVFATTGLEGQPNEKFEDKRTNGIKTFQIKMESELLENKPGSPALPGSGEITTTGPHDCIFQNLPEPEACSEGGIKKYP